MKRLTSGIIRRLILGNQYATELFDKLYTLENIEEKLKVDLTVLFKALEQDYIYIYQVALPFGDLDKDRIVKLSMLQFFKGRGKDNDWCIIGQKTYDSRGDNFVILKQYGKKWALTREELNLLIERKDNANF